MQQNPPFIPTKYDSLIDEQNVKKLQQNLEPSRLTRSATMLLEFRAILDQMYETARVKNSDYTGGNDSDPFANFKAVEYLEVTSTEVGMLTRMTDKLKRIVSFVKNGTLLVKTESVEDTLIDLANYSILLLLYIREVRNHPRMDPTAKD